MNAIDLIGADLSEDEIALSDFETRDAAEGALSALAADALSTIDDRPARPGVIRHS